MQKSAVPISRQAYEFISKQNNDPIVERRTCRVSGEEFPIFQSDLDFYQKISPVFDGKKYLITGPTLCPTEGQRSRLMFRNERKLYRRKCDLTGKDIVTIYSADKPYKVYDQKVRWSDQRDPMSYGKEIDFDKSFNEQFSALWHEVPQYALTNQNSENSEYCNVANRNKNCYMLFGASNNEECYYNGWIDESKLCVDNYHVTYCENCYECVHCVSCISCKHCLDCEKCATTSYAVNCKNCNNCMLCTNLVNQQYCFLNEKITKEEYLELQKKYEEDQTFAQECMKRFEQIKKTSIKINMDIVGSTQNTGNSISFSKNICNSFDVYESENIMNSRFLKRGSVDIRSCSMAMLSSLQYECLSSVNQQKVIGSMYSRESKNVFYCVDCNNCQDCFGCVGLRNKSNCIFNKQYTKADYEKLVSQLIENMQARGERGEFFKPELSQFAYNETIAQEFLPLTKEEVLKRGFKWMDIEPVNTQSLSNALSAKDLPTDIKEVNDDILSQAILCEVTGRPFKIIKPELEYYRKNSISLPHKHPDIRHQERLNQRAPRTINLKNCSKCGIEMLSVYPADSESKVYCEACYNQEIYG